MRRGVRSDVEIRVSQENVQSPVAEGDIIAGKYRVERVLGVGGMGVVVAARHVELGELFALKFLLANFRENAEVSARFAREARTGIRVKNEHVARVFDVGTLPDGAPYMVMEHLTGEDLAVVIERRGRLPLHETVDLLLQACEALCEAHQLGVVHRDLKPANLFIIAGSDGLPFVKVLDFGISKLITSGVEDLGHVERGRPRLAALHVARAARVEQGRRPAGRHLVARGDPLRGADGAAALPGRLVRRAHRRHPRR